MICIFFFEGVKKISESRHSMAERLMVTELDDSFEFTETREYIFRQPEDYEIYSGDIDRIVLERWRTVMEDAAYDLGEDPVILFPSERDFRLFSVMKGKLGIHTGALEYYSFEALLQLADTEEGEGELDLIRNRIKAEAETEAGRNSSDRWGMEGRIKNTCAKYGMKAEIKGGIVYVTTYGGEWYFSYNDRPITLYHKNSVPVKGRDGKLKRHFHIQKVDLYSPLHALAYIRNHERAEERRLMGK